MNQNVSRCQRWFSGLITKKKMHSRKNIMTANHRVEPPMGKTLQKQELSCTDVMALLNVNHNKFALMTLAPLH